MEAPAPTTTPASDVSALFAEQCNIDGSNGDSLHNSDNAEDEALGVRHADGLEGSGEGAPAPTAPAPDDDSAAAQQVAALPEMWALFAEHTGDLVEAWRLMSVCKAARVGAKEWLGTLPGLVVCGGSCGGEVREV